MLVFGLKGIDVLQSKTSTRKPKFGTANDRSDDISKASKEDWEVIMFDNFHKDTLHRINTVLKEE